MTLAFTDAPGPTPATRSSTTSTSSSTPAARTYKGNVFSGGESAPGGAADPRNNVENVFLPAGTSGKFAVDVKSTNIAGDGVPGNADTTDQDYALVVSNAAVSSGPVLVHDLATPTEIGERGRRREPRAGRDLHGSTSGCATSATRPRPASAGCSRRPRQGSR